MFAFVDQAPGSKTHGSTQDPESWISELDLGTRSKVSEIRSDKGQKGQDPDNFDNTCQGSSEFERSPALCRVKLRSGERRGYWKYYVPDRHFKQTRVPAKIDDHQCMVLFDTGAEVSILDLI